MQVIEDNTKLIGAWEKLKPNAVWRTNISYLTKVDRYIGNGFVITEEGGEIVVRNSNGVKIGKLDPNDPYYPNEMRVKGEVSKRHFDPDDAGGIIVKKSWNNITITQTGIDDVTTHLARFGPDPDNAFMIERLNKIQRGEISITDYDRRFYTHELEEFARYKNKGIPNGTNNEDFYYNAHTASLETYSINEVTEPLYHPK